MDTIVIKTEPDLTEPPMVCWCCGTKIEKGKFVDDVHEQHYNEAKEEGKELSIRIDERTTIKTTKYDRIPQIVLRYTNMVRSPYGRR